MKSILKLIIVVTLLSLTINAESQIKLDIKKKIENKVNQKINQKTDQAIDKGVEGVEGGAKEDAKKTEPANESQKTEGAGEGNQAATDKPAGQEQPKLEAYSKYDFIPGEKVIFYEDFSQDAVGDFPALWNTNGSAEVVTTNLYPGNWMKYVMRECVWTDALLKLPDNYTIEFDIIPIGGLEGAGMSGWNMRLMQAKNVKSWDSGTVPGQGGFYFSIEYFGRPSYGTWLYGDECQQLKLSGYKEGEGYKEKENQNYHIAIWVQKSRIRLY
jgi:OmpA-OmpF porin, OOP family